MFRIVLLYQFILFYLLLRTIQFEAVTMLAELHRHAIAAVLPLAVPMMPMISINTAIILSARAFLFVLFIMILPFGNVIVVCISVLLL